MDIMKLEPVLKELIWGGSRLTEEWGFQTSLANIAEDWALCCHKQGTNIVANGDYQGKTLDEVLSNSKLNLVGSRSEAFSYFPVLIKLIDAKDDLSIQVHPENQYAMEHEGEFGKTEMWYVLDCTEDAQLIYGFQDKISSQAFQDAIEENTLLDVLNTVKVKKGDVFFIEAGTVHAIGKGVLIAEIQQNSNTTYRVYDYNRLGFDGKPRELHVKKAVDVAVTAPPDYPVAPKEAPKQYDGYEQTLLAECPLFVVNRYRVTKNVSLEADTASFRHVLVTDGSGQIDGLVFQKGDSFFVPAGYGLFSIEGSCEILVTNI